MYIVYVQHIFSIGSDDRRIIVWDCERGLPLSSILLHVPILGLVMSSDASRVAVHLYESQRVPIICLHNTPAAYVKVPVYVAPAIEGEFGASPRRILPPSHTYRGATVSHRETKLTQNWRTRGRTQLMK